MYSDKKTLSVADAVKKIMEASAKKADKDYDKDGKIESGKDEYLGSRIRAAKMAGKMKEEVNKNEYHVSKTHKFPTKDEHAVTIKHTESGREHVHSGKGKYLSKLIKTRYNVNHYFEDVDLNDVDQLDEAFPTVADGEKSLKAKEGKTSKGTLIKTKTGVRHERDYDDEKEPEVKRGRGRPKKRLSEMRQEYLQFMEEVDNETFTKEFKDQKAKFDGKKKGADVAKPAVQAVKQEEYEADDGALSEEQLDEISKELAGKYLTAPQGKGANKYKVSADKAVYPDVGTMVKHGKSVRSALSRTGSLIKKPSYYKEEQMDEALRGINTDGTDPTHPDERKAVAQQIKAKRSANRADPTMSDTRPGMRKRPQYGQDSGGQHVMYRNERPVNEEAPPGREDQVKALKKVPGIDNPYAVSWASYRKSHPKKD